MTRMTTLSNPLLLGFEEVERLIDRAGKGGGDGYPPYNIERIALDGDAAGLLRITLAVAGFSREDLEITLEDKQLTIRGKQQDDKTRDYLYRGIASRQFSRTFVLADGIEVKSADLANGLLAIDLQRLEPERLVVFCDEDADIADPVAALAHGKDHAAAGIDVLIGPEGGFATEERDLLLRQPHLVRLSLGPCILRADTAAVAALTLVQAVL